MSFQAPQLSLAAFGHTSRPHRILLLLSWQYGAVFPGKTVLLPCSQCRKALGVVTESLWRSHQSNRSPERDYGSGPGACHTFLLSPFSRYLSFAYCWCSCKILKSCYVLDLLKDTPEQGAEVQKCYLTFFKRCIMLLASWLLAKQLSSFSAAPPSTPAPV